MWGRKRIYENLFADHLRHNRQMLFVSGPRQVGKTTLAKLVLPEGRYFNYDRTSDALLFAKGPDGLAATLAFDQPAARAENFVASHLLKSVDWWTDSGLGRFELGYIRDKQQHEVDFIVVRDGAPFMLVECKTSAKEPMSASLKSFAAKLNVPYACQVAVDAPPSDVDPRAFQNEPVKISFADLAKVLI